MTQRTHVEDPWLSIPGPESSATCGAESSQPGLQIETIADIAPLDAQIGAFPKKTVPDVLRSALFGQPDPCPDEIGSGGGGFATVPPLNTFAILDAARITNLPELLEDSTLEHRCLFKGAAYDDLKNVAPWVVRLEDGNSFTRGLFTDGPAPWQMWSDGPGMVVRARAGLHDIWRHFRRFTRVRDEQDDWFYFRFWEPRYAKSYFSTLSAHPDKLRAWFTIDSGMICSIGVSQDADFTSFSYPSNSHASGRSNRPFRYEEPERIAHIRAKRDKFTDRLCQHLLSRSRRFGELTMPRQKELAWHFVQSAAQNGMKIERAVADFADASVLLWRPLKNDPECLRILESNAHQLDKGKKLLRATQQRRH